MISGTLSRMALSFSFRISYAFDLLICFMVLLLFRVLVLFRIPLYQDSYLLVVRGWDPSYGSLVHLDFLVCWYILVLPCRTGYDFFHYYDYYYSFQGRSLPLLFFPITVTVAAVTYIST